MKTTDWKKPKRSLRLQPGDQPTDLLDDLAQAIAKRLHQVIPRAFPKPVDWNKIQTSSQKSDEPAHEYYNQLQIVLKVWSSFRC